MGVPSTLPPAFPYHDRAGCRALRQGRDRHRPSPFAACKPAPSISPSRSDGTGKPVPAGRQRSRQPSAWGRKALLTGWQAVLASGDPFLSSLTPRNVGTKLLWFRDPSCTKSRCVRPHYLYYRSTRKAEPRSDPRLVIRWRERDTYIYCAYIYMHSKRT